MMPVEEIGCKVEDSANFGVSENEESLFWDPGSKDHRICGPVLRGGTHFF